MSAATESTTANLSKNIDNVFSLRKKKADLESKVKEVNAQIEVLETEILEAMESSQIEKTSTRKGTASLSSQVVAQVTDWDKFWAYVYRNKYGHLLQRRVSDAAWRELQELGKKVPGTAPFVKKRVAFRAA